MPKYWISPVRSPLARSRGGSPDAGQMKRCYVIAGPNGAGKTTFAKLFIPSEGECINFVNADLIAEGLSPLAPDRARIAAGKLVLERIDALAAAGESFANKPPMRCSEDIQSV